MSVRVSKISLTVFVVMLVLAGFLLSVAGNYWPWYAITSVFAVVPLVIGPRRYRILGAVGLGLSVLLIVGDLEAGRRYRERRLQKSPVEPTTQAIKGAAAPNGLSAVRSRVAGIRERIVRSTAAAEAVAGR